MRNELRESVTLENEGLKLFGMLHRPIICQSGKKVPCVVILHGLGGNKIGRFRINARLATALAENGIAAFRFDFRGCGDSEGLFSQVSFSSMTQDALTALSYVSNHPSIDPASIAILGKSFGGAVAVQTAGLFLQHYPRAINGIILMAAVFDAKPWIQALSLEKGIDSFSFHGELLSHDLISQFRSYNAKRALAALQDIPFFIIQGDRDTTIGTYHIEQYEALLKDKRGTQVVHLEQADHEFSIPSDQKIAIDATVKFAAQIFHKQE